MTQVTRRELFPGVWLRTVHTDKFKSSYLSLTMLVPLDRERAAANALLFPRRGEGFGGRLWGPPLRGISALCVILEVQGPMGASGPAWRAFLLVLV